MPSLKADFSLSKSNTSERSLISMSTSTLLLFCIGLKFKTQDACQFVVSMMIRLRLPCLNLITVMEKSRSSKSLNLFSITSWMADVTLEDSDLNASDWSDDSASAHWVFHSSVSRYLFNSKMFSNHLFFSACVFFAINRHLLFC